MFPHQETACSKNHVLTETKNANKTNSAKHRNALEETLKQQKVSINSST
jgi:hypothetical protein